ncbi:MAG: hypothetical protein M9913_00110 [Bryobacteraceae bacterium]|jgi:hypothetical protein|nr:hypothetical protein [Solibacteraceae bacterium]MCL4842558.1 hypothetical protein [Bryobacteraceae bacterium]MCO5349310.1 hypothetical protein [Bryobacteraceae bacterium]
MASSGEGPRIDRRHLSIVPLNEKPNDRQYWLSKTPEERFEALELLRQAVYGYDPATARLQRVLEIVKRPRR